MKFNRLDKPASGLILICFGLLCAVIILGFFKSSRGTDWTPSIPKVGDDRLPIKKQVQELPTTSYVDHPQAAHRISRGAYQGGVVEKKKEVKAIEGIATAYSPYDNQSGIECDGDPSNTSTGVAPGPQIMAVDPSLIPYGSEITLTYPDGTKIKGIAGDTGGALRNSGARGIYHIDVFKWTYDEAVSHGVQKVKIKWDKAP